MLKDNDFRTRHRVPVSHGLSGAVAVDGEALTLDNALTDPRYDPDVDCVPGLQTRSMLLVPVLSSKPTPSGR